MAEKVKGLLLSSDGLLGEDLKEKLATTADMQAIIGDVRGAYSQIKEAPPRLLFLDIRNDPEAMFGIAGRVERFLPEVLIFMVNDTKDPDLIIRSLKTGADDFITLPMDNNGILTAVNLALEKGARGEKDADIIIVHSSKGGEGVTTLSVNLAGHIRSLTGGRVLLVDLKAQTGDVALFLDLEGKYTVPDLIQDMPRLDENLLFSSLIQHPSGFYVLTAPDEIDKTDIVSTEDMGRMFGMLKEYMDYIIVDMAHEFSEQTASVIDLAEKILLLSQQTVPALKAVRKTLDLFKTVGYEEDKIKIIINRYEKGNAIRQEEMETLFGQNVFALVANDYRAVTDAINKGKLLSVDHEGTPADRDIAAIASRLTSIQKSKHGRAGEGFLGNLFGGLRRNKNRQKGW